MKRIILSFLLVSLTSCSFDKIYENRKEDKDDAQKITQQLYHLLEENNNDAAFKLFSSNFFQVTSKNKLSQVIDKTKLSYGNIESEKLTSWRTHVATGSNPVSKYEMTYQVTREKGSTQEVITLQKENDSIKIIGYRIDFDFVPPKMN